MGLFSGLGKLAGGLFGASQAGGIPRFDFSTNITTPSFNLKSGGGATTLTRTGFPQRFSSELGNLADLRGQVRPSFGRFTEAAVESIRRAKADALGTARQQLQRRRVLGSSFGNAQLAAIEQKAGRDEFSARADALLKEIDQTFRIINQESELKIKNFKFELDELGIAADVSTAFLRVVGRQAEIDKEIAAKAAAGSGSFFAEVFGDILGGSGKDDDSFNLGKLFSGGGFANPDKALSALTGTFGSSANPLLGHT